MFTKNVSSKRVATQNKSVPIRGEAGLAGDPRLGYKNMNIFNLIVFWYVSRACSPLEPFYQRLSCLKFQMNQLHRWAFSRKFLVRIFDQDLQWKSSNLESLNLGTLKFSFRVSKAFLEKFSSFPRYVNQSLSRIKFPANSLIESCDRILSSNSEIESFESKVLTELFKVWTSNYWNARALKARTLVQRKL